MRFVHGNISLEWYFSLGVENNFFFIFEGKVPWKFHHVYNKDVESLSTLSI